MSVMLNGEKENHLCMMMKVKLVNLLNHRKHVSHLIIIIIFITIVIHMNSFQFQLFHIRTFLCYYYYHYVLPSIKISNKFFVYYINEIMITLLWWWWWVQEWEVMWRELVKKKLWCFSWTEWTTLKKFSTEKLDLENGYFGND